MKIDIYLRPQENPRMVVDDTDLRLHYNEQWVDFKDGKIFIKFKNDPQKVYANSKKAIT